MSSHNIQLTEKEASILLKLESDEMAGEPKGDLLNECKRLAQLKYITSDRDGYIIVTEEGKKWMGENLPKKTS